MLRQEAKSPLRKQAAPSLAVGLQMGMNAAKKFVWKHMSAEQKARYLLRRLTKGLGL